MQQQGWWVHPQIMRTKVFHKRTEPAVNAFTYHVYYLAFQASKLATLPQRVMRHNRFGLLSYYHKDHGKRDGSDADDWAIALLQKFKLPHEGHTRILLTMPRVLGHVFNPVSFWLSIDEAGALKSVIAEVNNTFNETHAYVLAHDDGRDITTEDTFDTQKNFHVSPFLKVEGHYRFRFSVKPNGLGIWIDYFNAEGRNELCTSMVGTMQPFTDRSALRAFVQFPLVTLKVIALIHWQALRLFMKRVRYRAKPKPPTTEATKWRS
jgi:DUF1365 family protein